jgi:hypothetical protein
MEGLRMKLTFECHCKLWYWHVNTLWIAFTVSVIHVVNVWKWEQEPMQEHEAFTVLASALIHNNLGWCQIQETQHIFGLSVEQEFWNAPPQHTRKLCSSSPEDVLTVKDPEQPLCHEILQLWKLQQYIDVRGGGGKGCFHCMGIPMQQ